MESGNIILPGTMYDDAREGILTRGVHLSLTVQFLLRLHYMGISVHVADLGPLPPVPSDMTQSLGPRAHLVFMVCFVPTLRLLGVPALTQNPIVGFRYERSQNIYFPCTFLKKLLEFVLLQN